MCGVVVDAESFRSTWHGRDAYVHDHCLRCHHNYVLFYQLLDGNLCTHRNTYAISREATSETYGPGVYLLSYKFPIYFYLQSLLSNLYHKNTTFASYREGIDNPFIALVARFLIVCAGTRWLVCRLLLDWYLGSQNWGKYLRYFAALPFPLQEKTNACSRGSSISRSLLDVSDWAARAGLDRITQLPL